MTPIAPGCGRAGIAGGAPPILPKAAAWLITLLCICVLAVPLDDAAGQSAPDRPVLVIDIKGAIGFVSAGQLTKALERAAAQDAPAVIVRLDTPGGLLSSTREMIQTILAARVPVVMYVAPNGARAASAGTYLLYASHGLDGGRSVRLHFGIAGLGRITAFVVGALFLFKLPPRPMFRSACPGR